MVEETGNNWGKIIERLRMERGLSRRELARLSKLSPSYIDRLEHGDYKSAHRETLIKLAGGLDMGYQDLVNLVLPLQNKASVLSEGLKSEKDIIEVPVLGRVPAGYPWEEQEQREGTLTLARASLRKATNPATVYLLVVSGNSLIGDNVLNGDKLLVDPDQREIVDGKIYIVRLGNEVVARHVYKADGIIRLVASTGYQEIQVEQLEILGKVLKVIKEIDF